MSRIPDDEIDRLAAEYALGTLAGDQRKSFERLLENSDLARTLLQQWEHRLADLADQVTPLSPPEALWQRIETAISKTPAAEQPRFDGAAVIAQLRRSLQIWRFAAGGAALAAVGLALFLLAGAPGLPGRDGTTLIAVLQSDQPTPAWFVEARLDAAEVQIRPLQGLMVETDRDLELWAIIGPDRTPLSLGILAREKPTNIAITTDLSEVLRDGITLAVSLEPMGGSPSGLPTGPVIFTGSLQNPGLGQQR